MGLDGGIFALNSFLLAIKAQHEQDPYIHETL